MKKAYYLIEVEGVEPILHGPFRSELGQSKAAKRIRRSQGQDGLLFWADVDHTGVFRWVRTRLNSFFGNLPRRLSRNWELLGVSDTTDAHLRNYRKGKHR